jgi:hypothetical protein
MHGTVALRSCGSSGHRERFRVDESLSLEIPGEHTNT